MRKRYGSWTTSIMLAVLGVLLAASTGWSLGTIKHYPTLSLRNYHINPDGIQRVPQPGPGGERYFLVPIYIYNEVDTTFNPNFDGVYQGQHLEPLRSFEFQLYYPAQAVILDTVHGSPVVVVGPDPNAPPALAKTFFARVSDRPVPVVPVDSNGNHDPNRHVIQIAASSEVPLPLANTSDSGAVLLWLRFKVIPNSVNAAEMFLDTSLFNDHRGDPDLNPTNWQRGNFGGGQGVGGQQKKGYGLVQLTPQPIIEFRPFSQVTTSDNVNFDLVTDLIYDPTAPGNVTRSIQLRNGIGNTDLTNVRFCSDQQWLMVSTSPGAGQQCDFISVIHYTGVGSEEKNIYLSVPNASGLAPGIYYGTVTFVSDGAGNSPAKLRVRFIRLASPNEPSPGGSGTGIRLNISNSCAPVCTSSITFGTGVGATAGMDLLYGEQPFTTDSKTLFDTNVVTSGRCYAYFDTLGIGNADIRFKDPGFLGITRDIRNDAATGTILFKVNFSAGDVNCYPVKVCVDPNDFPAGARVVMRFTQNGSEQGIDLRQATIDPNTGVQRCVTISDRRINSFYIEYTPGTKATLTNLIPNAWNLISLPVVPPNPDARVIFPNAGGIPYAYRASIGWDPPIAGQLEFGRGYMVKYGSYIGNDTVVAGVRAYQIRNIRIDEGWNTIGAASTTATLDRISLTPLPGQLHVPQLISDVWEFVPTMGYQQTTFLKPGHGYFIKSDAAGYYNLDAPVQGTMQSGSDMAGKLANGVASLQSELSQVTVRDARGNGQQLFFGSANTSMTESRFEMPAMASTFDARFDANNGNTSLNHSNYVVNVRATSYPVTMNFTSLQGDVVVRDMQGHVLGTANGSGIVTISDPNVHQVEIALKGGNAPVTGFNLEQNVPNPFNSITSIGFNLPSQSEISLVIYNELGQVVRTLVSGTVGAGYHSVPFDASELANGTYYYTLKAGNYVKTIRMQLAK